MSRPKSPARLALENQRAFRKEERERKRAEKENDKRIRTERWERKLAEKEAKHETRLRKRITRESVVRNNGIPKVQSGGAHLGIHDAIAYAPLVICGGCGVAIRESTLIGDLCPKCKYGKEVQSAEHTLKANALEGGQVGRPGSNKEGCNNERNASRNA